MDHGRFNKWDIDLEDYDLKDNGMNAKTFPWSLNHWLIVTVNCWQYSVHPLSSHSVRQLSLITPAVYICRCSGRNILLFLWVSMCVCMCWTWYQSDVEMAWEKSRSICIIYCTSRAIMTKDSIVPDEAKLPGSSNIHLWRYLITCIAKWEKLWILLFESPSAFSSSKEVDKGKKQELIEEELDDNKIEHMTYIFTMSIKPSFLEEITKY